MKKFCILSDFDGTISTLDSLYSFFKNYATEKWKYVEKLWLENKINSKECLIQEFSLVPNLSQELADKYIKTVTIDKYFKDFYDFCQNENIDFYIVSDGVDYFINGILENHDVKGLKIITNHGVFNKNKIDLSFPNDNPQCVMNAGTCKCKVANDMKKKYEKIIYIGDGVSDFCVCDKADIIFAKSKLARHCEDKGLKYKSYENFNDILSEVKAHLN